MRPVSYSQYFTLFCLDLRLIMTEEAKQQMRKYKNPLVWIDLEVYFSMIIKTFVTLIFELCCLPPKMSGLDVEKETIMELACIITDGQLENVKEGPGLIIHQPDNILDNMDEWCTNQHGKVCINHLVIFSS